MLSRIEHRQKAPILRTVLAIVLVWTMLPVVSPAHAATRVVTTTTDSVAGSLRAQIASAATGDTIDFSPAMAGTTILLTGGELTLNKSLTLQNTSGGTITVDGQKGTGFATRVFLITNNATILIQGLTIQNGSNADGAGVKIDAGATLTLDRVIV